MILGILLYYFDAKFAVEFIESVFHTKTGLFWVNAVGFSHGRKAILFAFYLRRDGGYLLSELTYLRSQVGYLLMILCYLLSVEVHLRTGIIWIFSMQSAFAWEKCILFELADLSYLVVVAVYIKGPAGIAGPWL